jgi:hypothetical protein
MDDDASQRYTDAECEAEFACLFPQGFAGQDVLAELAPEGWEKSSLVATLHPSLEQVYQESVQLHRNLHALPGRDKNRPADPEPTRAQVARTYQETPIDTAREVRELVGKCLWDIFSDNHEVIGPDQREVDIGSFRGAGGFIADWLNRQIGAQEYDYIDFYMGTIWLAQRADLTPVYRMIFRRLKARGHDWIYHFPRLGLVDLRPWREALHEQEDSEGEGTQEASAQEEDEAHDRAVNELRASLDIAYRDAVAEARQQPPPPTVQAYHSEYGHYPEGWPPVAWC